MDESKLPLKYNMIITQILQASKFKSKTSMRYSEDWILLCILFHMRSPSGYRFILSNNILPLPCPSTLRRYLSLIDTKFGFDDNFFEIFSKFIIAKPDIKRHGVIAFDEMKVRESVAVCSKSFTY